MPVTGFERTDKLIDRLLLITARLELRRKVEGHLEQKSGVQEPDKRFMKFERQEHWKAVPFILQLLNSGNS
jgi:hypothetical protein